MICAGDEISHTQKGNNNSYCQDDELSQWLDWTFLSPRRRTYRISYRRVIQIRKGRTRPQRRRFFQGPPDSRQRGEGYFVFRPVGEGDDRRGMEHRICPLSGACAWLWIFQTPGFLPEERASGGNAAFFCC